MTLTRIGAKSSANARAKASTAPQEAVATLAPGSGRTAAVPDIQVMDPPRSIFGAAYLAAKSAPQKRVSSAGRNAAVSGANPFPNEIAPAVMNT
jgi:hypothetical protein